MFEVTIKAIKAVGKMCCALLYESNSEALVINRKLSSLSENAVWKWYWDASARQAERNMVFFRKHV